MVRNAFCAMSRWGVQQERGLDWNEETICVDRSQLSQRTQCQQSETALTEQHGLRRRSTHLTFEAIFFLHGRAAISRSGSIAPVPVVRRRDHSERLFIPLAIMTNMKSSALLGHDAPFQHGAIETMPLLRRLRSSPMRST